MKKYVIVSGLNLNDNNRGTAALGYGAISFLYERGLLKQGQEILKLKYVKKIWKSDYRKDIEEYVDIDGYKWKIVTKHIFSLSKLLILKYGILLPFSALKKIVNEIERVVAINGGDGFSDIYGSQTFLSRLVDTKVAMKLNIPVIQLPQTLGPFQDNRNYNIAKQILQYAEKVFIRDDKFVHELDKMGVKYELTRDLSYYMKPQEWDIKIENKAIGVNVSGLAYSNKFRALAGEFENYPKLIDKLICYFRNKGNTIYLIPHSYNYRSPEMNNDDLVACREAYNRLEDKSGVVLIDKDLKSPQIKYLISKMKFFIGTRMHANFAAIYTEVPLFGLAYSYKFEGAFNQNGIFGQTAQINNITEDQVNLIVEKVNLIYNKYEFK